MKRNENLLERKGNQLNKPDLRIKTFFVCNEENHKNIDDKLK